MTISLFAIISISKRAQIKNRNPHLAVWLSKHVHNKIFESVKYRLKIIVFLLVSAINTARETIIP
jgi:hypothetical protein